MDERKRRWCSAACEIALTKRSDDRAWHIAARCCGCEAMSFAARRAAVEGVLCADQMMRADLSDHGFRRADHACRGRHPRYSEQVELLRRVAIAASASSGGHRPQHVLGAGRGRTSRLESKPTVGIGRTIKRNTTASDRDPMVKPEAPDAIVDHQRTTRCTRTRPRISFTAGVQPSRGNPHRVRSNGGNTSWPKMLGKIPDVIQY